MAIRGFKQQLYSEFARVAKALANDCRLEIVELLAQAPRHVEALAQESGMPVATVSQHLQVLRAARLVEAEREGTKVRYRLAGPDVLQLWLQLSSVAEGRLADVKVLAGAAGIPGAHDLHLAAETITERAERGEITLLDVRPRVEFEAGHLPGAISIPIDELPVRLGEIPRRRPTVAYCRGTYCLLAGEAVALLRHEGFEAFRLDTGWAEWSARSAQPLLAGL